MQSLNKTKILELKTKKSLAEIFDLYYHEKDAVFLDSSLQNEYGRYSIVGLSPYLKAEEINGILFLNGSKQHESFSDWLKIYLKENEERNPTDLPIISGGIGYFTYDYGRKKMKIKSQHSANIIMPDACLIFYSLLLIEDKTESKIYAAIHNQKGYDKIEELLINISDFVRKKADGLPNTPTQSKLSQPYIQFNFEKNKYLDAINSIIDYIIEGDIYIANMTQQLTVKCSSHPYAVFQKLRRDNPSPFGSYMNYNSFQIVSASPERFLKMKDKHVETRPIKGTRKRGKTKAEDDFLRRELSLSEKDKSELLMIVDLERNDLNRICEPNTVNVTELFAIETYATVFHLVSTIVGILRKDVGFVELLEATFPGGSITGAPKHRAMEIIDQLENTQRGLYTGTIGYVTFDNSCDFNIVIRTAIYQNGSYSIGVGGGITYESELQFEYEETLQKAKALLVAIEAAMGKT